MQSGPSLACVPGEGAGAGQYRACLASLAGVLGPSSGAWGELHRYLERPPFPWGAGCWSASSRAATLCSSEDVSSAECALQRRRRSLSDAPRSAGLAAELESHTPPSPLTSEEDSAALQTKPVQLQLDCRSAGLAWLSSRLCTLTITRQKPGPSILTPSEVPEPTAPQPLSSFPRRRLPHAASCAKGWCLSHKPGAPANPHNLSPAVAAEPGGPCRAISVGCLQR